MDYESLVYGYIADVRPNDTERRESNRMALAALPESQDWPLVARHLFSIPDLLEIDSSVNTEVFHFGSSYRGIEYEWRSWLAEFEQLLDKMYWVTAKVHLETVNSGTHVFTWDTSGDWHTPGSSDKTVHCEWSREEAY